MFELKIGSQLLLFFPFCQAISSDIVTQANVVNNHIKCKVIFFVLLMLGITGF